MSNQVQNASKTNDRNFYPTSSCGPYSNLTQEFQIKSASQSWSEATSISRLQYTSFSYYMPILE